MATLSNPSSKMSIMKSNNNRPTRNSVYGGTGGYANTNISNYSTNYVGAKDNSLASRMSDELRKKFKRK